MQENVKLVTVKKTIRQAYRTEPIWQYDVGHVLKLEGFDNLPETFQMHYSRSQMGDAITQIGSNGQVTLPDEFAQTSAPIFAWVYVAEDNTGLTKYTIEIPVMRRARITNQEPTPVEQSAIDQAISALNAGVTRAETAAANAESSEVAASASAVSAGGSATAAGNAATSAQGSAQTAQAAAQTATQKSGEAVSSANSAAASALSAGQSAQTATQKANDATSAATSAQGSASAASGSATAASGSAAAAAQTKSEIDDEVDGFQAQLTNLSSALSEKQNAPATPGTAGQVLGLDSNLAPAWVDQTGGDESGLAPVIKNTASGSIASFSDGADGRNIDSLVVNITPVQDLHGQDAPYPPGGGKNKFDGVSFNEYIPMAIASGITLFLQAVLSDQTKYIVLRTYDSEKTFLQSVITSTTSGNINYGFLNVTSDVSYIRVEKASDLTATNVMLSIDSSLPAFSPYSNLCPISGWDSVNITRTGVNVWNEEWEAGTLDTTTGQEATSTSSIREKDYIAVKPSSDYYFKYGASAGDMWVLFFDADKNILTTGLPSGTGQVNNVRRIKNMVAMMPDNCCFIRFYITASYGATYNNDVSINYPATDTSYHAYHGRTIPVSWENEAGTVFGGTVDIISGLLTGGVAKKTVTSFNGKFGTAQNGNAFYLTVSGGSRTKTSNMNPLCNMFTKSDLGYNQMPLYSYMGSSGSSITWTFVLPSTVTSTAEANAWLANLPEPIEFTYVLETPIVYQLSQNQLSSLLGQNNIFADCGSIANVEYSADTKLYIDGKIATLAAQIVNS